MDAVFNRVFIVESLDHTERKTGTALAHSLSTLPYVRDSSAGKIHLISINSRVSLFAFLTNIRDSIQKKQEFPLLHFEIHGSSDKTGFVLNSREYVSWFELKPVLTQINVNSRNNLVIVQAVCHGIHMLDSLSTIERATFCGLVGPETEVFDTDIEISYLEFYKTLLGGAGGDEALKVLNYANPNLPWRYHFISCERAFRVAFSRFHETYCSDLALSVWADTMHATANQSVPGVTPDSIKERLKNSIPTSFEKFRDEYFMFDLFPENRQRFKVELSDFLDNATESGAY